MLYGGDNGTKGQYLVGGYGDDKIFSGHNISGVGPSKSNTPSRVIVLGDAYGDFTYGADADEKHRGRENDGDDLIDIGDTEEL